MRFTDAKENPTVKTMAKTLADYCISEEFNPKHIVSTGVLETSLQSNAQSMSNKEGMMTQHWQLDAEPVESIQYWEESKRKTDCGVN